jgi:hypothetical protein
MTDSLFDDGHRTVQQPRESVYAYATKKVTARVGVSLREPHRPLLLSSRFSFHDALFFRVAIGSASYLPSANAFTFGAERDVKCEALFALVWISLVWNSELLVR